jgi:hypothetical protein
MQKPVDIKTLQYFGLWIRNFQTPYTFQNNAYLGTLKHSVNIRNTINSFTVMNDMFIKSSY